MNRKYNPETFSFPGPDGKDIVLGHVGVQHQLKITCSDRDTSEDTPEQPKPEDDKLMEYVIAAWKEIGEKKMDCPNLILQNTFGNM